MTGEIVNMWYPCFVEVKAVHKTRPRTYLKSLNAVKSNYSIINYHFRDRGNRGILLRLVRSVCSCQADCIAIKLKIYSSGLQLAKLLLLQEVFMIK